MGASVVPTVVVAGYCYGGGRGHSLVGRGASLRRWLWGIVAGGGRGRGLGGRKA